MATSGTNADSLRLHHTGAGFAGGTQRDPAACLGGIRAGTEVRRIAFLASTPIQPIRVDNISGINGVGTGTITAVGTSAVKYTAPSGTVGAEVSIANGATALLEDTDPEKVVRITRDSSNDLGGEMSLALIEAYNNALGMSNITSAQAGAGVSTYRGVMLRAATALTDLKVWQDAANSGISISWEVADGSGDIQTIANENTAPSSPAPSWNTGTTSGTGLTLGSLAVDTNQGLWIRRVIGGGASGSEQVRIKLYFQFVSGAVTYDDEVTGLYRVAENALVLYSLFSGEDANPDFTAAAAATSATLPVSAVIAPPGSGNAEWRVTCRQTNAYGEESQNQYTRSVWVASTGATAVNVPTAPQNVTVLDRTGGNVLIKALYSNTQDASPADTWATYWRANGSDPVPATDTAEEEAMAGSTFGLGPGKLLNKTIGPVPQNADLRVIVRALRSGDSVESTNTTATTLAVGTIKPPTPQDRQVSAGNQDNLQQPPVTFTQATTTYDVGTNTRAIMNAGYTDFYVGANFIWRMKYDSLDPLNNGVWTTYGILQGQISGVPVSEPVDVVDATELYITSAGVRRFKMDVSATRLGFTAIRQGSTATLLGRQDVPIYAYEWQTLFFVWDIATWQFVTVAMLDSDGVFFTRDDFPWRQRATTGEFE